VERREGKPEETTQKKGDRGKKAKKTSPEKGKLKKTKFGFFW